MIDKIQLSCYNIITIHTCDDPEGWNRGAGQKYATEAKPYKGLQRVSEYRSSSRIRFSCSN